MCSQGCNLQYRETSNIKCTLVCNKIVNHSNVVGESPVSHETMVCAICLSIFLCMAYSIVMYDTELPVVNEYNKCDVKRWNTIGCLDQYTAIRHQIINTLQTNAPPTPPTHPKLRGILTMLRCLGLKRPLYGSMYRAMLEWYITRMLQGTRTKET